MDHGNIHDMGGMAMAPTPTMNFSGGTMPQQHKEMMMHMTFYWGMNAEVLFHGWPGEKARMYAIALVFVFAMSFLIEWISHSRVFKPGTRQFAAGLIQTLMHAIRVGLAYMVMLALMSFNLGVLLAAVGGHALGFLLFESRLFDRTEMIPHYEKAASDHPIMSC